MNLALIIGQRAERIRSLSACLEGLGMSTDTCADGAALACYPQIPRVIVWDDEGAAERASDPAAAGTPADGTPPSESANACVAPIQLWIAPPHVHIPAGGIRVPPPANESQLLAALLMAGYHLPDDAESNAIAQTLHDLVDGDATVVAELIDSLLDTAQTDLADYRTRCAEQNWPAAGALAHRIKGTARLAGCASLTRLCQRIERAAREEGSTTILPLNALFEPAQERLCTALGRLRLKP